MTPPSSPTSLPKFVIIPDTFLLTFAAQFDTEGSLFAEMLDVSWRDVSFQNTCLSHSPRPPCHQTITLNNVWHRCFCAFVKSNSHPWNMLSYSNTFLPRRHRHQKSHGILHVLLVVTKQLNPISDFLEIYGWCVGNHWSLAFRDRKLSRRQELHKEHWSRSRGTVWRRDMSLSSYKRCQDRLTRSPCILAPH